MSTPYRFQAMNQSVIEIASRLREITSLKSVHIIPAHVTGWRGWSKSSSPFEEPFSVELGRFAGEIVASEFANALLVSNYSKERPFRIGIAAGSTIHSLVKSFHLPDDYPYSQMTSHVEITPLVIGPVPETIYSAGFIADALHRQLPDDISTLAKIAGATPIANGFKLSMGKEWIEARDVDLSGPKDVEEKKQIKASPLCFDWVITGIGSKTSGPLQTHLKLRYKSNEVTKIRKKIVGDICSRLFDAQGEEEEEREGDTFVAPSFDWLRFLSNFDKSRLLGRRVIAVTGGQKKYEPLKTLLNVAIENPNRKLFNVLITDELTARRLLRDLLPLYHHRRPGR